MSTSLANSSQATRRSPRRPNNDSKPCSTQNTRAVSQCLPPTPPAQTAALNPSPAKEMGLQGQASVPRKKSQGSKKQNQGPRPVRPPSHTRVTSQSNLLSPDQKTTPLKQAYAGPTFHSSPAASSLPMPSFYSKSLPTVTASPALSLTAQLDGEGRADVETESLLPARSEVSPSKAREPSPLDFMFEAARKARDSPKAQSPDFRAGRRSPFDDISASNARTPGDATSESVFPFELDGNRGRSISMGPSFATPYKERMAALRSPKSQSTTPTQLLDEEERKQKSEALKRLLINASPLSSPQKPGTTNSYFPERAFETQPASSNSYRTHHKSGPSTPQSGIQHPPVARYHFHNMPAVPKERDSPNQRPTSSYLRREYQPDNHQSLVELDSDSGTPQSATLNGLNTRRSNNSQIANNSGVQAAPATAYHPMQTRSSLSAQQLEDDLRRVLKLDFVSSN